VKYKIKIEFANGGIIKSIESTTNSRGHRSTLISFYCEGCKTVHEDYPISNIFGWKMCKESLDKIVCSLINIDTSKC